MSNGYERFMDRIVDSYFENAGLIPEVAAPQSVTHYYFYREALRKHFGCLCLVKCLCPNSAAFFALNRWSLTHQDMDAEVRVYMVGAVSPLSNVPSAVTDYFFTREADRQFHCQCGIRCRCAPHDRLDIPNTPPPTPLPPLPMARNRTTAELEPMDRNNPQSTDPPVLESLQARRRRRQIVLDALR